MILADKIIKLRKQFGWSQEELAEKMNISRQSVSKWESTNSIPDLNRIILLAEIFDVSTDFLLKDDVEAAAPLNEGMEPGLIQISLEQALKYVENKMEVSGLIAKGVVLCICSVIPLFFLLAIVETEPLNLTSDVAVVIGIVSILAMVSFGISFFIKINQYESDLAPFDNERFELAYGVHSIFKEKLQKFTRVYNQRLTAGISMFIFSFMPLMVVATFIKRSDMTLMMLIVMFLMIATGIYIIIPVSTKYEAYNYILKEGDLNSGKSRTAIHAEKLAAVYWPLLTAIYIGWSLWTMDWDVTWIVWPVGAVAFAALVGLKGLLDKDSL